jgi:plasmid stabilization system protein ParE
MTAQADYQSAAGYQPAPPGRELVTRSKRSPVADSQLSGRSCDHVRSGLRRMEHGRHVVFLRRVTGGIFVSRILHERMLPEKPALDDAES